MTQSVSQQVFRDLILAGRYNYDVSDPYATSKYMCRVLTRAFERRDISSAREKLVRKGIHQYMKQLCTAHSVPVDEVFGSPALITVIRDCLEETAQFALYETLRTAPNPVVNKLLTDLFFHWDKRSKTPEALTAFVRRHLESAP